MKKILTILLLFIGFVAKSQTWNPSIHVPINDAIGQGQQAPIEGRSMYWDGTNFLYRPFASTAEVLTYLNTTASRFGDFIIVVDSGGTLLPNGHFSNGHNTFWIFADSTGNANLVKLNLFGTSSGGGTGTVTTVTASNGNGLTWTITNPNTIPNISLGVTLGGDLSGTALNNATVAKFAGLPPAYYLNYNNLTNQPTIPPPFNPIAGAGIALSGSSPNITFSSTILAPVAGTYIKLTGGGSNVINLDTFNYRKVDTLIGVNDSTLEFTVNHQLYSITLRGGTHGGGGGGSGTVTNVSVVTANGVSGAVANPTSTPAITLTLSNIVPTTVNALTLQANTTGFSIWGGSSTVDTLNVVGTATLSGTNTGNVTLAGQNYLSIAGQVITANPVNVSGSNITGILAATSFPAQTGDVTNSAGALANTITANAVTYAKFQTMPAFSFLANSTNATANTQASYFKYGLIWSADSVKVDTTILKAVFGSINNNLSTGSGLLGGPYNGSAPITFKADTSLLATQYDVSLKQNTLTLTTTGSSGAATLSGATLNIPQYTIAMGTLSGSPNSQGGTVTGNTLQLQLATYTYAGLIPNYMYAHLDSSIRGLILDTTFVKNYGTGTILLRGSADTLYSKTLNAGTNISIVTNSDSSLTINSTGGSAVQSATYVINYNGTNYVATPIGGSSYSTITNTDFYTVLQGAINALTPTGTSDSIRGKIIIAINGQAFLSNQITIHGKGSSSPYFQLTIEGLGTSTEITQNTAGKHAFYIDNGACVVIRDMQINAGASAYSCIWTDSLGTQNKASIVGSIFDNLYMTNSNASYPAMMLRNIFSLTSNHLQAYSNHSNAIIIENATTSGIAYGNSSFGLLELSANDTSNGNSALLIRSTNTNIIDHIDIKNLYIIGGKYGLNISDGADIHVTAFDIENPVVIPIIMGSTTQQATSHNWAKSNTFGPGGTVLTASKTTPLIVLGPNAFGNNFNGTYLFPDTSGVAIVTDSSATNMGNAFVDMHIESPGTANPYFARTSVGTFTYTSYVGIRGNIWAGTWQMPGVLAQGAVSDSNNYKPVVMDASGNLRKSASWFGGSGGGAFAYTVATAANTSNYTVTTANFIILSDLTGQANRNIILPTGTSGQILTVKNNNTFGSTFTWTFTNGTVLDNLNNTVTTLTSLSVYQLTYDGTNWDIIN